MAQKSFLAIISKLELKTNILVNATHQSFSFRLQHIPKYLNYRIPRHLLGCKCYFRVFLLAVSPLTTANTIISSQGFSSFPLRFKNMCLLLSHSTNVKSNSRSVAACLHHGHRTNNSINYSPITHLIDQIRNT